MGRPGSTGKGIRRSPRVHGEIQGDARGIFELVHALVRAIPRGRVMTYGQISVLLGSRISPVAVGWAMHGCPDDVPWHRVVNAAGGCSTDRKPEIPVGMQRALLEGEGVEFRLDGTIEVERYRWSPEPATRARGRRGRRAR
jgi:methylated-DNA-protein-cysteine methyltransferase related protein